MALQLLEERGADQAANVSSAFTLAEISLVISLTSAQLDISWMSGSCLKKLVEMEKRGLVLRREMSPEEARARELAFCALSDSSVVVTGELKITNWRRRPHGAAGRLAMQKRIRKILQNTSFPTNVNVAIWEESYRRWMHLGEGLNRASEEAELASRSLERKKTMEVRDRKFGLLVGLSNRPM